MTAPDMIVLDEALGRGVFSSKEQKRAQRSGKARLNVFLEARGNAELSVDRLDCTTPEEAAAISDRIAVDRQRRFYGWATVVARLAAANGRRVVASPRPSNPYHADIVLPDLAADDYEEQRVHAQQLADASRWRSRPTPP